MDTKTTLEKLSDRVSDVLARYDELRSENELLRNQVVTLKAQNESKDAEIERLSEDNATKDLEIEAIVNKIESILS